MNQWRIQSPDQYSGWGFRNPKNIPLCLYQEPFFMGNSSGNSRPLFQAFSSCIYNVSNAFCWLPIIPREKNQNDGQSFYQIKLKYGDISVEWPMDSLKRQPFFYPDNSQIYISRFWGRITYFYVLNEFSQTMRNKDWKYQLYIVIGRRFKLLNQLLILWISCKFSLWIHNFCFKCLET